jgi:hypothetical protein
VFGSEIDEDLRRLIDEGWREVSWVKNARTKRSFRRKLATVGRKISRS